MQARRTARTRSTTNENADENRTTATTRLTRAKAASLSSKATALQSKPTNVAPVAASRKRAALGDVSNVHKAENNVVGEKKPAVKKTATKTATKATASKMTKAKATAKTSQTVKVKDTVVEQPRSKKRPAPVVEEVDVEDEENRLIDDAEVEADTARPPKKATKRPKVEQRPPWDDLDKEDMGDPLMCAEYVEEIFEHLRQMEPQTSANPDYMTTQEELKWDMRGILVDWLVEVHTRFRLLPETLFLAVNIVDRFLSNRVVTLDKLQLVGITAMFIAAKYEEVFSPHVQYFRHVADDGFTEEEILRAERFILQTLDFNLSYPNPMNFLRRISKADEYDFQTRTFAKYMMEISLVDHRFIKYRPSRVAAAAMYLSRMMLDRGSWDGNLIHYSDYTEEEIVPVFHLMVDYLIRPVKHEAFYKKYASKKFMKASIHARKWAKEHATELGIEIPSTDIYGKAF